MTDPTTTMTPPGATGAGTTGTGAQSEQSGLTQAAGEQAQQVKEQAKEQVQQVAGQAKEQARNVADQAKSQVDQRSTQAGETVSGHASDLRSVADALRTEGKDQPAKLAEQVAERLEKAGSWLTDSDADKILHEVEDFGRQRPWAVIGAGVALGIAASRMLKASSTERYTTRTGVQPYSGTGGSMVTPTPRGLPDTTGTGLQGTGGYEGTVPVTPPTTPRTGEGTWSGPGNGTTY